MRFLSCLCVVLGGLLGWPASSISATQPAPDEFIVPLQGAVTAPVAPSRKAGRVRLIKDDKVGMPVLRANTAQEAIAAAVGQRDAGCRMIRFGNDDFGWVATGIGDYTETENAVTTRRARRSTRFKAFTDAQTRLTACLRGLPPEMRQRISERLEQDDAIRLALINLAANDEERRDQALRILARGFTAYTVDDDAPAHTIRVHLVATPKTAVRLTRPAANAVETVSPAEGLKQTLAEVENGLTPPAGNRLIVVNATGEPAFVGYAVNLVGLHPDPAAQGKLRADAEKIAVRRATEALVGLVTADDAWQNELDEASRDEARAAAHGYEDGEASVRRFGQIRDLMLSLVKDDAGLQTLREGGLPSAATVKRFGGDEAVAVVVSYAPQVKKREAAAPAAQQPTAPTAPTTEKKR